MSNNIKSVKIKSFKQEQQEAREKEQRLLIELDTTESIQEDERIYKDKDTYNYEMNMKCYRELLDEAIRRDNKEDIDRYERDIELLIKSYNNRVASEDVSYWINIKRAFNNLYKAIFNIK